MKKICILGLGYIGLPTASLFATNGFKVVGVDINETVVNMINRGKIHIKEPGLNTIVQESINSGNFKASTKPIQADAFFICVPTPIYPDKTVNLSFVTEAAYSIIPYLKQGDLIILESTSPPRTTMDILVPILQTSGLKLGEELFVAYCPERVLPGKILYELVNNNRIIGGINHQSSLKAREIYKKVVQGEIIITDATSAEMAKLMENTFRDVNIALANELCKIAYDLKLDAHEVIKLANMHPRVNIHQPGPGVGGHCIAVDPWFIVEKSSCAELIKLSRQINDSMPSFVVRQLKLLMDNIDNPVISVFGVAYKGNVDDTRESPATEVIKELVENHFTVKIYDPYVNNYQYELTSFEDTVFGSDIIVILADHEEFKQLSPDQLGKTMRNKILFDTKNCLNHSLWEKSGFLVKKIGKYDN